MKYDHLYLEEDRELVLHEHDPDLPTMRIPLPKAPENKQNIINYGLHPDDQKFFHHKMPPRLEKIEGHVRRFYNVKEKDAINVDDVYRFLEDNKKTWKEEILWIKEMIHYRYHGMWIYIHGKPVYLNRWNWFFLNQWDVGNEQRADGLPDFRDRDWMYWTASLWLYNSTEAPFQFRISFQKKVLKEEYFGDKREYRSRLEYLKDANNKAIHAGKMMPYPNLKGEEGDFLVDMGVRVNYGINYPKGRRDGATYRSQCNIFCVVTEAYKRFGGIQSKSDTDAASVFDEKLIKPWQKLWFFFSPYQDKGKAPKTKINFQKSNHSKNTIDQAQGISGWVEQRPSGALAFDGEKLHAMHHDEVGKKEIGSVVDVKKRWSVAKKCLSTGAGRNIIGWAMLTSTVNKMEKEGGREFHHICKQSMYNERNRNGQTSSGLVNIFIPAYVGLEGFVDEYGNTVIDDPETDVMGVDGRLIKHGSYNQIMFARKDLELQEDWEGLNEEIRQAPIFFKECFKEGSGDSPFNIKMLSDAINEHRMYPEKFPIRTFDLEWKDGVPGPVVLVDNPSGKFRSSWLPPQHLWNKMKRDDYTGFLMPNTPIKTIVGVDPVKFGVSKFKKKSNGAMAMWYPRDEMLDPDDKPKQDWVSHRFKVTYNQVIHDKNVFLEDGLKLCIFTGSYLYPESNIPAFHDYFYLNGFGGYCLHHVDNMGKRNPQAGRHMTTQAKNDIFTLFAAYINSHAMYEKHLEILEEVKEIGDPKNMGEYDLFAAGGMGMLGGELLNTTFVDDDETEYNLEDYFLLR